MPRRANPNDINFAHDGPMRVSIDTLRRNQDKINTDQKCQVDPTCRETAISKCSERAYRGCTMAYCNNHSGQLNRRKRQSCLCKICTSDKHVDICSECSNDILKAQRKFYCISTVLTVLVFCVLLCLLHIILMAIPGLCPTGGQPGSSAFCNSFHNFWHKISIYDRETAPVVE